MIFWTETNFCVLKTFKKNRSLRQLGEYKKRNQISEGDSMNTKKISKKCLHKNGTPNLSRLLYCTDRIRELRSSIHVPAPVVCLSNSSHTPPGHNSDSGDATGRTVFATATNDSDRISMTVLRPCRMSAYTPNNRELQRRAPNTMDVRIVW